jgi:hypothetical protein
MCHEVEGFYTFVFPIPEMSISLWTIKGPDLSQIDDCDPIVN